MRASRASTIRSRSTDVSEIYLPITRLLALYVAATQALHDATRTFLGTSDGPTPYIIGLAGSVAVGKSTTARVLRALLRRWPNTPKVDLVATDGFLLPNATLERLGLMEKKGFPESYDRPALSTFLADIKAGKRERQRAGLFASLLRHRARRADRHRPSGHSHRRGAQRPPDLEAAARRTRDPVRLGPLRLLDLSRRRRGRSSASGTSSASSVCATPRFRIRAPISTATRESTPGRRERIADGLWGRINLSNLRENILPTRPRAQLILRKGENHRIEQVALRRI